MPIRKTHSGTFKGKVALDAVKEEKTIAEFPGQDEVHPTQNKAWKPHLLSHVENLFVDQRRKRDQAKDDLIEELYKQIGQLKVEVDWMKKKLACSVREKAVLVDLTHPRIRVSRQVEFLGISRSSISYTPVLNENDVEMTRLIDEIYTEVPCYRVWKINAASGDAAHQNPGRISRNCRQANRRLSD